METKLALSLTNFASLVELLATAISLMLVLALVMVFARVIFLGR